MNILPDALSVEKPETYSCQLYGYIHSHQQLLIEAYSETESFYLHFETVIFFSGATGWLGADFVIESPETCLDFLRSSGLYARFDMAPDDEINRYLRLYGVRGSHPEIKILAGGNVYRTDKAPSWTLSDSENEA